MKLGQAFTFHYLIFVSMAMLLTPVKFIHSLRKVKDIIIEKKQFPAGRKDAAELLHGEVLFRY